MPRKFVECPVCKHQRWTVAKRPKCKRELHKGTLDPEPRMFEVPFNETPDEYTISDTPPARKSPNWWENHLDRPKH